MAEIEIYGNSGTNYMGDIADGIPHGTGSYTWPDGGTYECQWELGAMNGSGVGIDPDGSKYDGEWANGQPNGAGTMTHADGSVTTGTFVNGISSDEI